MSKRRAPELALGGRRVTFFTETREEESGRKQLAACGRKEEFPRAGFCFPRKV